MAARAKRSKRPSAASSGSKLPERLVFFIDRSLGKKIVAQALREVGEAVEIHDDHFAPDSKDEDWLDDVGKRGRIVLTKDDRIRYRVTERTPRPGPPPSGQSQRAKRVLGAEHQSLSKCSRAGKTIGTIGTAETSGTGSLVERLEPLEQASVR